MRPKPQHLLPLTLLALLATAIPASAEIVFLSSGRTLSVKSHTVDGDQITLTLRSGGEVTCSTTLIDKIEPDEVPYIDPDAPQAKQSEPTEVEQDGSILEETPYGEIIASVSEAQGVNPLLVRALIQVESKFRPTARSPKGAMGLMQLMPSTARAIGLRNARDPVQNILGGAYYLRNLANRFEGDLYFTLAAYNAGPGAVQRYRGVPPYPETQSYVRQVLSYYWRSLPTAQLD